MSETEPSSEIPSHGMNESADIPETSIGVSIDESTGVAKMENSVQESVKTEGSGAQGGNTSITDSGEDGKVEAAPTSHLDKTGAELMDDSDNLKRPREDDDEDGDGEGTGDLKLLKTDVEDDGDPIPASKEGTSFFHDADVLSGRGGGTNVHPGNRNFRDLINLHRRAYLKARKNDKPAISRAIVRSIRDSNGRFLRKDDKSGLWFEIGDDAAREKTSQALRQRAPEMRKLLFDTEREEARSAAEDHLRHQRMMMGMPPDAPSGVMPPGMQMPPMGFPNPAFFQAMAANGAKPPGASATGQDPYQMFQAAMMNNNMNRFPAANGGS